MDESWRPIFPDDGPEAQAAEAAPENPAGSPAAGSPDVPAESPLRPAVAPATPATPATPRTATEWTPPPAFDAPDDFYFSAAQIAARRAERAAMSTGEERFRSARWLAYGAMTLLGVSGLVGAVSAIHYITGVDLQGKLNRLEALQPAADAYNRDTSTLAVLTLGLLVATAIVFIAWLWRSMRNAPALGADISTFTPRDAVTAWLVPIRNLWKPYLVVQELHDWLLSPLESATGRWLIRSWWACWLAGTVVGWLLRVQAAQSSGRGSGGGRFDVDVLLALAAILNAADAILAIAVVAQVQRLSNAREAARRGDPHRAIDLVTRSQRRRVTLLPFGLAAVAIAALVLPLGLTTVSASAARPWQVFSPDGAFSIEMPGTRVEEALGAGFGQGGHSYRSGSDGTIAYVVLYADLSAGSVDNLGAANMFDTMVRALPSNGWDPTTGTVGPKQTETTVDGRPARKVRLGSGDLIVTLLMCIDGDRLYVAEVDATLSKANSADVDRFLDSFHIK